MIELDGSVGEGGGQILRTSLTLAALTGQAVRFTKIRAKRPRPGLMRQHLAAVEALAAVCDAEVSGACVNSQTLVFAPGAPHGGEFHFAIGTAGSTTLVLQTVLLPLMLGAAVKSRVVIEGGTHNMLAPPFDFIEAAFLPVLRRMGAKVSVQLERHGFYPAGGGRIVAEIDPAAKLAPLELLTRGALLERRVAALSSAMPKGIGRDEAEQIARLLDWPETCAESRAVESAGPGNVAYAVARYEQVTELVTAFGARDVSRETVARRVADQMRRYLQGTAPVGRCLADQLLLPLALAGGGRFRTLCPSGHTRTNIEVIGKFLPVKFSVKETGADEVEIGVSK
ncbi:MAG: RNA 3'-terminal phosphate cyclase [Verrucomicrobiota bacterium]|jgi:RNA 3'-terminal phosphate cyclase (ATP)|nr:RNA 3'-terminal phosphate cyclase [Verrucomicrobiota bacterium]